MTLVSVRLDNSFATRRLVALADSRASLRRTDGSWQTLSDTTEKLFAIPVRCHELGSLTPVLGAWTDPYYRTTIGVGFSGSCFEGLTIIAHLTRCFAALVAPDGDRPRPCKEGVLNLVQRLVSVYKDKHHAPEGVVLHLLIFGFDGVDPWVGRVSWVGKDNVTSTVQIATPETLECIGQPGVFEQYATELRRRVDAHRKKTTQKRQGGDDPEFERSLSLALDDLAERKAVEEGMLREIEASYAESVGGVLQRLELATDGNTVEAGFTQDDRPYLESAYSSIAIGTCLGPIPIVERMGRSRPVAFCT